MEDLQKQIDDLKKEVELLNQKRIFQQDIVPQAVKGRHIGEGPWFVRGGIAANKPTKGEDGTDSVAIYYDTTANKLWVYNGSWKSVTLS